MAKITFKNIQTLAKDVKNYVDKNKKLPKTVTVNKVTYTFPQIGYILSKSVASIGKDVTVINVKEAPDPTGETVKLDLTKDEYIKEAKEYYKFIEDKKRIPNYSTIKNKKVKQRVMIYSLSKIIVWYTNNNKLPGSCRFYTSEVTATTTSTSSTSAVKTTTTKTKSKYGHATKSGCDNMGQNTSYYCACHSFQEVVRNLYNVVIPQKTLASVMGTTSSGTDHLGIKTAVAWFNKKYNKKLTLTEKYFSDVGADGLKKIIASENQDFIVHLAYQGKYGHYEVVNSIVSSNWNIQNSLGSKCDKGCYCGHKETRSFATEKSWINAKSGVKSLLIFKRN